MTTTLSPKAPKRIASIAIAVAMGGAAVLPGISASAAGEVTLPAESAFTKVDKAGYAEDTLVLPATENVKWKYKIGTTAETTPAAGSATPKALFTAKPAATNNKVTVVVTPVADDGFTLPDAPESYSFEFDVAPAPVIAAVTPKAPTVKVDKKTGLDVVTLPFIKGLDWMVKEGAATTGTKFVFTGTKAEVYATGTTKPTKLTFTATVDSAKNTLGKDGTVVLSEVVIDPLKSQAQVIEKPTSVKTKNDLPGTSKDSVVLEYKEGIIWVANGKDIKLKEGKTATVKRAKGADTVDITFKAAVGYAFAAPVADSDKISNTFTNTENAAQTVTLTAGTATVKPTVTITPTAVATVKTWSFTPSATGAKEIKFALPKGMTTVKFNLPGAGTLKAVPVAGYKVANPQDVTTGTAQTDGSMTWAVTAAS